MDSIDPIKNKGNAGDFPSAQKSLMPRINKPVIHVKSPDIRTPIGRINNKALRVITQVAVIILAIIGGITFIPTFIAKKLLQTNQQAKLDLQNNIGSSVLNHLENYIIKSGFALKLDDTSLSKKDQQSLQSQYQALKHMITEKNQEQVFGVGRFYDSLRASRTMLNNLVKDSAFKKLAQENPHHPFIQHIRMLATKMRTPPSQATEFRKFGRHYTKGAEGDEFSLSDTADYIAKAVEANSNINKDDKASFVFFSFASPTKSVGSLTSGFREETGRDYSSYEWGNLDAGGYTFTVISEDGKEVSIPFHYGPGPQSDHLFDAEMELKESYFGSNETYCGPISPQVNLQKPHSAEGKRSHVLTDLDHQYSGMHLLSLPMDGKAWKMQGEFDLKGREVSVGEFVDQYKHFAIGNDPLNPDFTKKPEVSEADRKNDNGFYIPSSTCASQEVEQAFEAVKVAIGSDKEISGSEHDKRETGRAVQLCTQTFITLRSLYVAAHETMGHSENMAEKLRDVADEELKKVLCQGSFGQACKQDIDRGIAANVLTRLFAIKMNGGVITRDILDETVGAVIGRAEMVDRRNVLIDRIQPAIVALKLADESESSGEAFFDTLKCYVTTGLIGDYTPPSPNGSESSASISSEIEGVKTIPSSSSLTVK